MQGQNKIEYPVTDYNAITYANGEVVCKLFFYDIRQGTACSTMQDW